MIKIGHLKNRRKQEHWTIFLAYVICRWTEHDEQRVMKVENIHVIRAWPLSTRINDPSDKKQNTMLQTVLTNMITRTIQKEKFEIRAHGENRCRITETRQLYKNNRPLKTADQSLIGTPWGTNSLSIDIYL